jgi:hypothetical protein
MTIEKLEIDQIGGAGDNLCASIDYEGWVQIEVEEPWAGDTEAGFGRTGAIRLNRHQALMLAQWLQEAAEGMGA